MPIARRCGIGELVTATLHGVALASAGRDSYSRPVRYLAPGLAPDSRLLNDTRRYFAGSLSFLLRTKWAAMSQYDTA